MNISGFSKHIFIKGQLSGISIFFTPYFWEFLDLALPHILSKTLGCLVSIGWLKSSWTDARRCLYELLDQSLFFGRYCSHLGHSLSLNGEVWLYLDYFDHPGAHISFFYLHHQGFFEMITLSWISCCDASLDSFSCYLR